MKPRLINILLLMLAVSFSSYGSPPPGQDQANGQTRDLFTSYTSTKAAKGKPGAKIRLELLRAGLRQFVPLTATFHAGDRVKLHFEVNFAAYITIYNLGTSGRVKKLYPARGEYATAAASTNYVIPASPTEWFEFDETPGMEKLNFTFSAVAPQRRPAKAPARPTGNPAADKNATDVVIVEPGGRTLGEETDNEASDEALDNGRDLTPVQLKDAYYVIGSAQQLRQRVGILIVLDHR